LERKKIMPLYEYVCGRCSKNFEEIVYNAATMPACPICANADEVARIPFAGSVTAGKKEDLRPPDIKSIKPRR
jgi:putative FmdB family regulatory protein